MNEFTVPNTPLSRYNLKKQGQFCQEKEVECEGKRSAGKQSKLEDVNDLRGYGKLSTVGY